MNILLISSQPPLPENQGARIRVWGLLRELAQKHNVYLLALSREVISTEDIAKLESCACEVILIPAPRTMFRKIRDIVLSLLLRLPYTVLANTDSQLVFKLSRIMREKKIDLIQLEELYVARNLANLEISCPVVLDAHNCEGRILKRLAKTSLNPIKVSYYAWQARMMDNYEKAIVRRVDSVFTVSAEECQHFEEFAPSCYLIPNGVKKLSLVRPPGGFFSDRPTLLYCGSFDYQPNCDAVIFFVEAIWPLIVERNDQVRLTIVGRKPPRIVQALRGSRIDVRADVASVEPYYLSASALVVPLRVGGGTRLKILEAFSYGLPVVSTTIGAEGLAVIDGHHLLIRDIPTQFADAVLEVLQHRELASQLVDNAAKLVGDRYLWSQIGEQCDDAYGQIFARRNSNRL